MRVQSPNIMRKSTRCLRIIACGGGSIIEANEVGPVDQIKSSKGRRGWSFKKKSSTSRAVTNSLTTETPPFERKESVNFVARDSLMSEKDSAPQWNEKSLMPPQTAAFVPLPDAVIVNETKKQPATAAANSYVADEVLSPETEKHSDAANFCATDGLTVLKTGEYEAVISVQESDVRKELESIIKLQAVVRGHLVRCHAVGALRCLQAIAKMQVLVRARYAHRTQKDHISTKSRPEITYTSMSDLLKNSFARQLLESSSKSKPIKIKCDPLSRDSSWFWLERWTSLASPCTIDDLNAENGRAHESKTMFEDYLLTEENDIILDAKDKNFSVRREHSKLGVPEEPEVTNSVELTLNHSTVDSSSASLAERQKHDILDEIETVEPASEKSLVNNAASEYSQLEADSADKESETKTAQAEELLNEATEQGNEQTEELKTEVEAEEVLQLQTVNENNVSVSHELVSASAPLSANLPDSVIQDVVVEEPISDTHLAVVYRDSTPLKGVNEECPASVTITNSSVVYNHASHNGETEDAAVPHSSEFDLDDETVASSEDDIVINHDEASIQVGESDCSTELSITSTLDSPDGSEAEPVRVELEKAVPGDIEPHESKFCTVAEELEIESGSVEQGKSEFVNGESVVCATAAPNVFQSEAGEEKNTKTTMSDLDKEPEPDTDISNQASPGSQVTFSESHGTPSSQVSVSRKSKIVKSGSIKKQTILSAFKKSPMSISTEKNSSGKQPKDQNSVKRRTSFGSPKAEVSNQELRRNSSTSSSLPSYMQATKSARAKANAAGQSPRSSPDIPDNDIFLSKRHSLSSVKDKQDSPRFTQTTSKAHSSSKSNSTSPLERKWQR